MLGRQFQSGRFRLVGVVVPFALIESIEVVPAVIVRALLQPPPPALAPPESDLRRELRGVVVGHACLPILLHLAVALVGGAVALLRCFVTARNVSLRLVIIVGTAVGFVITILRWPRVVQNLLPLAIHLLL